ncbi:hypothetical protein LXL04_026575 [Taraxacum kok-saghyz]
MGLELWSPAGRKSPTSAPARSRTPDLHPHEAYKPGASSQLSWGSLAEESKELAKTFGGVDGTKELSSRFRCRSTSRELKTLRYVINLSCFPVLFFLLYTLTFIAIAAESCEKKRDYLGRSTEETVVNVSKITAGSKIVESTTAAAVEGMSLMPSFLSFWPVYSSTSTSIPTTTERFHCAIDLNLTLPTKSTLITTTLPPPGGTTIPPVTTDNLATIVAFIFSAINTFCNNFVHADKPPPQNLLYAARSPRDHHCFHLLHCSMKRPNLGSFENQEIAENPRTNPRPLD